MERNCWNIHGFSKKNKSSTLGINSGFAQFLHSLSLLESLISLLPFALDFVMASVTTNWSPSSLQLRFSFHCRKSPLVFVRTRIRQFDRQVRLFCSSGEGNGAGRHRDENSWISPESKGDALSGWSVSDGSVQFGKSQKKRWPGGMDNVLFGC